MPALEKPASRATAATTFWIIHFILGSLRHGGGQVGEEADILGEIHRQLVPFG
jgi:hypothetical protein